jgi:2-polyprenyl-3-methyl-5-hydroxy-6-metoxy-1,4-benzoquinol methylase
MRKLTFSDDEARESWNSGARAYGAFIETGADYYRLEVHGPELLAACGEVRERDALDLGCGEGYFSRELARRGARVTGIDLSDRLIELAREREEREPLGVRYLHLSAGEILRQCHTNSFDLVTACMSLQDMADVGAALRGAFAVLRDGGRMAFSVPHPSSDTPVREWQRDLQGRKLFLKIDRYFETGPAICNWNMPRLTEHWDTPYWRYTLGEWSALVAAAGFLIRQLHEPRPTEEQVRRLPQLEDCARMPFFLVFELLKRENR